MVLKGQENSRLLVVWSILSLLFTLGILGCGGVNPHSSSGEPAVASDFDLENGGIRGVVLGSDSLPLWNATVETANRQAITASDGRYLLGPVPAGDYRVVARAPSYQPTVKEGVRVRAGVITENIDFTMSTGSASATRDFAVLALSPAFGTDGERIGVVGQGFGSVPGRVTVAGKEATILDWNSKNDGLISIELPFEVETGRVQVFINGEGSHETSPVIFVARPIALEVRPPSARSRSQVSVIGRNFHTVGSFNKVSLNGKACQVLSAPTTRQLDILLPDQAETGILTVRIEGNEYQLDGISQALVTILPELTWLSPQRSIPGVTLTLWGTNFGSDKNAVKVWIGESAANVVTGNRILSFSKNKLTFAAPDNTVVEAGKTAEIRVAVNEFKSNALTYSAYDPSKTTLSAYGIYDFTTVSSGNTLHLASLGSGDHIAFVSIYSANGTLDLPGDFSYGLSSYLGGNYNPVPTLPATAIGPRADRFEPAAATARSVDVGPMIRSWARRAGLKPRSSRATGIRAMTNPAPASTTFWMLDFNSANPNDTANDVLATGTWLATGAHCLVFVDTATDTVVNASDAEKIAAAFDAIYATLATGCWDGLSSPPEGNIDAQPRIVLFVTPQINRGSASSLAIFGYFHPRDKDSSSTHSAGTEILYLWDHLFRDNEKDFQGVMAHELQHMMYFNQKGLDGVTWLDEGLSNFAQQVAGLGFTQEMPTPVSHVAEYLRNPQTVSLNHWPTSAGLANYGMSYLFVQYLFDRCKGYQAIQVLEKKNGSSGFRDVELNVLPLAASFTLGIESFFHEYGLAMYCDNLGLAQTLPGNRPGIYEYSTLDLRTKTSGVLGLRHLTFDENPVANRTFTIKGYGCDVLEYASGNGGDLEVQLQSYPTNGGFKTWVIYFPDKR